MLSNLVHHLFNSHPHKEDDKRYLTLSRFSQFFNSHPHKEDDKDASYRGEEIKFSTHILTRRMTNGTGKEK